LSRGRGPDHFERHLIRQRIGHAHDYGARDSPLLAIVSSSSNGVTGNARSTAGSFAILMYRFIQGKFYSSTRGNAGSRWRAMGGEKCSLAREEKLNQRLVQVCYREGLLQDKFDV
jgi:hypothetical protein